MKKLLIVVCALSFIACKKEATIDYALFSGKIENPNSETLSLRSGDFTQKIAVNKDGTFADTLRVDTGFFTFNDGKESSTLYLEPGYNLNMTLNTKEFDETITYTGNGSENNNYLASKALNNEKLSADMSEIYAFEEANFLTKIAELNTSKVDLLNGSNNLSSEFITLENKNLKFAHLSNLQNYPSYHEYYAKKENVVVSDDFMKPLADIDFTNEEDYKSISSYKRMVQRHFSNKLKDAEDVTVVFNEIKSLSATAIKNDLAKTLAYDVAPNNEMNKTYYDNILAMSTDDKFKTSLTEKYNKVKLLVKGMPSPEFVNYENHKGGKTSLNELKGKYVYIDVWATWCGPCKREIPFLKEVESKYHGKKIEFVSTSIDQAKDHDTWVKMVAEKELGGLQLMADNDWKSKFVTDYAIEGIPRFILVDPEGNIVTADAPRPSDTKLIELFDELKI